MNQCGGLRLSVQPDNKRTPSSLLCIKRKGKHQRTDDVGLFFFLVVPHERTLLEWVLLWVTVKAGFLHCIDGVAQKLMGILLAAKPEVAGNF